MQYSSYTRAAQAVFDGAVTHDVSAAATWKSAHLRALSRVVGLTHVGLLMPSVYVEAMRVDPPVHRSNASPDGWAVYRP